ncbi:MAG: hypothetical protein CALGDGBN_01052 [Pseudomonadales bacterium]|nr:hypothetical protein [Pseudomonadales bacterium]
MIRVQRNRPRRRSRIPRIPARSTTLPRILRRFYVALVILLGATVLGTLGFHYGAEPAPHWSDSLYMTLITISTVGYGEVVPVDTPAERIFTGLLSIAGFGVLTFLFTSLTVFFLESDLDYTLRRRRMERRIRKLRDHYIVCGFGRVGRNVATELRLTHRQFVVIDTQEAQLTSQAEHFPELLWLAGDASDDDQLLAADIDDALGVFAVTGDDSRNLMIALTAKQLNPKVRVVARCHEVRNIPKLRKAGADAIVSPDFTGGMRIASQITPARGVVPRRDAAFGAAAETGGSAGAGDQRGMLARRHRAPWRGLRGGCGARGRGLGVQPARRVPAAGGAGPDRDGFPGRTHGTAA